MRAIHLSFAASLVAVTLAGCGTAATNSTSSASRFTGAERDVAAAVDALSKAGAHRDATALCSDVLAASLIKQIEATRHHSCETAIHQLLGPADSNAIKVEKVTVKGNKAQAQVTVTTGSDKQKATLGLVLERHAWRVSDLGR